MCDSCVTPSELAKQAGVRRQMIFNYLAAGRIKGHRDETTGRWMIHSQDADVWLARRASKEAEKMQAIREQLDLAEARQKLTKYKRTRG